MLRCGASGEDYGVDPFAVLGVQPGADFATVKRSFRAKVRYLHSRRCASTGPEALRR